jgi:hypothetical protein
VKVASLGEWLRLRLRPGLSAWLLAPSAPWPSTVAVGAGSAVLLLASCGGGDQPGDKLVAELIAAPAREMITCQRSHSCSAITYSQVSADIERVCQGVKTRGQQPAEFQLIEANWKRFDESCDLAKVALAASLVGVDTEIWKGIYDRMDRIRD